MARGIAIFFFILMMGVIVSIASSSFTRKKRGLPDAEGKNSKPAIQAKTEDQLTCTLPSGDMGYCKHGEFCDWVIQFAKDKKAGKIISPAREAEKDDRIRRCLHVVRSSKRTSIFCCETYSLGSARPRPLGSVHRRPGPSDQPPALPNQGARQAAG